MKDEEEVIIDNKIYVYDEFYDRLQSKDDNKPAIACPQCYNTKFSISYGDYECIANCECGHFMTIYDG